MKIDWIASFFFSLFLTFYAIACLRPQAGPLPSPMLSNEWTETTPPESAETESSATVFSAPGHGF
jgi:hypothetical protein